MNLNQRLLTFQGFNPSHLIRSYLDSRMTELYEESPCDSSLNIHFTQSEQIFRGIIRIHSMAGSFFACANGTKLQEVSDKLFEQIKNQLKGWKALRFESPHKSGFSVR